MYYKNNFHKLTSVVYSVNAIHPKCGNVLAIVVSTYLFLFPMTILTGCCCNASPVC